jgi:hypothetical protein
MLYMSIGKDIIVIAVKHSSEDLSVDFIFFIYFKIFFVHSKEFDHVKSCFWLV